MSRPDTPSLAQILRDYDALSTFDFERRYPAWLDAQSCHPHAVVERDFIQWLTKMANQGEAT